MIILTFSGLILAPTRGNTVAPPNSTSLILEKKNYNTIISTIITLLHLLGTIEE